MSTQPYLKISHQFTPSKGKSYIHIPFEILPDTEYLILRGRYTQRKSDNNSTNSIIEGKIDIGLIDAEHQIRGWSSNLNRVKQLILGEEQASYGYLAGAIQPGTWNILLGNSRAHSTTIIVEIELELVPFHQRILKGDIHGHSFYSDGRHSIEAKIDMARTSNLDFIAFTDHNSVAQNSCLPIEPDILLLPSCEITTYNGHINIFGYRKKLIPNFACHSSEEVHQVLTELKRLGVHLQLNHPIRLGDVAGCRWNWDYKMPFDWMEIWNGKWNQNNVANVALWQSFLEQGRFIPAVGNSDFHTIDTNRHGYPCNNVWARQKIGNVIYNALAQGHNYITAEPLSKRSFAARCLIASNKELLPFGSNISIKEPLLLELTTSDLYLMEFSKLLLRIWNETGLHAEIELKRSDFHHHAVVDIDKSKNRIFLLDLLEFQKQNNRAALHNMETHTIQDIKSRFSFLRFELFAQENNQEEALLLSNPIIFQGS